MSELSSCIPKAALNAFDDSNNAAPVLNYNTPQGSSFDAHSIVPFQIDPDCFIDSVGDIPIDNQWALVSGMSETELEKALKESIDGTSPNPLIPGLDKIPNVENRPLFKQEEVATDSDAGDGADADLEDATQAPVAQAEPLFNMTFPEFIGIVSEGKIPQLGQRFYGSLFLDFREQPTVTEPALGFIFRFKVKSYLSDYSAGKTIKTFSLLPGEKTSIAIRSFKRDEKISKKAENVLDSFTENSSEKLENSIEKNSSNGKTDTKAKNISWGLGANASLNISLPKVPVGGSVGGNASLGGGKTSSTTITEQVNNLTRALDQQVNESSAVREIDVNTEATENSVLESENSITRDLENINVSRVLNFVFRQLLQKYITITYLDQVEIAFTNGYPGSFRLVQLADLDALLEEVLNEDCREDIKNKILDELANLYDHTKTQRVSFIKEYTENKVSFATGDETTVKYVSKSNELIDTQSHDNIHVPGIIMDVREYVLRTDAVIVDALLGQGEALDCYNMNLQNEAVNKAKLDNMKIQEAIDAIKAMDDAELKAKLLTQLNTECCDVPQSGCGCNQNVGE